MDEAAWGALALTLTLLGGIYTWVTYQRHGLAAGLRGGAIALLPLAAWLTGILELVTEIGGAVGDWAIDLALDPRLWIGAALAGVSVVLFVVSGFLARRGVGGKPDAPKPTKGGGSERKALPTAGAPPVAPVVDDGIDAEIEAILRKRGIT